MKTKNVTVGDILRRRAQQNQVNAETKAPKKKLSLIEKRQIAQKEAVLEEMKNIPILLVVCKKTNISRATVYRWLQTDSEFRKEYEKSKVQGSESINDIAKLTLITKIKDGDFKSSVFWLTHRDREFAENKWPIETLEKPGLTPEQKAGFGVRLKQWKNDNLHTDTDYTTGPTK